MPDRGALRDVLALRPDDLDNLFLEQLGVLAEPDTDRRGEQPLLRRVDQLAQCHLNA
jgi:hypothetical protein